MGAQPTMYSAVPEIEIEQPAVARSSTTTRSVVYTTVGLLLAASCVVMLTSTETAFPTQTTDLASSAVRLPRPSPAACANVKDWNFFNAELTVNNLGGAGPNLSGHDAEEIRYSNVADEIDLVLTIDEAHQARLRPYVTNPTCKDNAEPRPNKCVKGVDAGCPKDGMTCGVDANGMNGKFGQVNVKGGTEVALKFTLVDAGTTDPVFIADNQKVFFSVFDLDNGGDKNPTQEYLKLTTEPMEHYMSTPTEVKQPNPNPPPWNIGRLPRGTMMTTPMTLSQ